MDPGALLGLFTLVFGPAAIVGGITTLVVRAAANSRGLPPPEVTRLAMRGFWISFIVTFALTLIGLGVCIAAFAELARQGG